MRHVVIRAVLLTLLGGALGLFVIWPAVESELMKIPMTDGISAVRHGDLAGLRQSFAPGARVVSGNMEMPIDRVLVLATPLLAQHEAIGPLRFAGYSDLVRRGGHAEAKFAVVYEVDAGEWAHGDIPVRVTGHVELERESLFRWKIVRLVSDRLPLRNALNPPPSPDNTEE